jgi:hypothetical protein
MQVCWDLQSWRWASPTSQAAGAVGAVAVLPLKHSEGWEVSRAACESGNQLSQPGLTLRPLASPSVHATDTQRPQTPWYHWVVQWPGQPPGALWTSPGQPRRGVVRVDAIGVSPSNFCAQISSTSNFSTKNLTRLHPCGNDVPHNSIRVDIGENRLAIGVYRLDIG